MKLLKIGDNDALSLVEYHGTTSLPPYAILSHTWGADSEEITYHDLVYGTSSAKSGYSKLEFCIYQARQDGLSYFWVDTCCIDKSSSAELQEAINSMFKWYRQASVCYVYLSDITSFDAPGYHANFQDSRWFTRGWTLQELLAPPALEFYSKEGVSLGDKMTLLAEIHDATGIPTSALDGTRALTQFSVAERFEWAQSRQTKREEDIAYCLLGILDVYMPLLYGEGEGRARYRLKQAITEAQRMVGYHAPWGTDTIEPIPHVPEVAVGQPGGRAPKSEMDWIMFAAGMVLRTVKDVAGPSRRV